MIKSATDRAQTNPVPHEFDNDQALSEGWGIFYLDPPFHDDEPFQLEAVANPEIGPEVFDDDDDAWRHVKARAADGSAYHQAALDYIKEFSPREWSNFINTNPR